eukprot:762559-Hanusia_phi.AAC.15
MNLYKPHVVPPRVVNMDPYPHLDLSLLKDKKLSDKQLEILENLAIMQMKARIANAMLRNNVVGPVPVCMDMEFRLLNSNLHQVMDRAQKHMKGDYWRYSTLDLNKLEVPPAFRMTVTNPPRPKHNGKVLTQIPEPELRLMPVLPASALDNHWKLQPRPHLDFSINLKEEGPNMVHWQFGDTYLDDLEEFAVQMIRYQLLQPKPEWVYTLDPEASGRHIVRMHGKSYEIEKPTCAVRLTELTFQMQAKVHNLLRDAYMKKDSTLESKITPECVNLHRLQIKLPTTYNSSRYRQESKLAVTLNQITFFTNKVIVIDDAAPVAKEDTAPVAKGKRKREPSPSPVPLSVLPAGLIMPTGWKHVQGHACVPDTVDITPFDANVRDALAKLAEIAIRKQLQNLGFDLKNTKHSFKLKGYDLASINAHLKSESTVEHSEQAKLAPLGSNKVKFMVDSL